MAENRKMGGGEGEEKKMYKSEERMHIIKVSEFPKLKK